jgi:hypothetical protein
MNMGNETLWNLLGDRSKIVKAIADRRGVSEHQAGEWYDAVMPNYHFAMTELSYGPYVFGGEAGRRVVDYVRSETGLDKSTIEWVLMEVQGLAAQGLITIGIWNANIPGWEERLDPVDRLKFAGSEALDTALDVGGKVGKVMTPLILLGGIAVLLMYGPAITKALKAKK